jgi:threonine dehydrogenase-like Zn-dependent dehydrogenase
LVTETVRAAVILAPGHIEVQTFPFPEEEPGAVLVKMEMSGICGTDKHTFSGYTAQYVGTEHERNIPFPVIPGHENVGRIAWIGPSPQSLSDFYGLPLQEGDRVVVAPNLVCGHCYYCRHGFEYYYCANLEDYGNSLSAANPPHLFGGWADYLYVLPGSYLFKVPEDLPSEIAVLTELMGVTTGLDKAKQFSAVDCEGFRFGDTVVIQGVGPLGLCHVMKARMLGAGDIIVIDRSKFRLKMALELGADHALNLNETNPRERLKIVRELTNGRGADLVVECAGVPEAVSEGLELLRPGGFYVECGNFSDMGPVPISPHLLCSKNVRLIGVNGEAATAYGPSMQALRRYRQHYPVHKVVTHRYPVEQAESALRLSMTDDCMKVVIASPEFL